MTAKHTVADEFTPEEWMRFWEAGMQRARDSGGWFTLDEAVQHQGERQWAAYIRAVMEAVGVGDLAARIDTDAYEADSHNPSPRQRPTRGFQA